MEFLEQRLRELRTQNAEVETRLKDLNLQHSRAADLETATTLSIDIRNLERALRAEGELRAAVGGFGQPVRVRQVIAGETDQEFRARAERELAAIHQA
jgi:hypothetical protein